MNWKQVVFIPTSSHLASITGGLKVTPAPAQYFENFFLNQTKLNFKGQIGKGGDF